MCRAKICIKKKTIGGPRVCRRETDKTSLSAVQGIGKKAVVEGVETPEMERMLRENSCDYLQGFLFSRPLPEEDFVRFIRERRPAEPLS